MPRAELSHGIVHYRESGSRTLVMRDQPERAAGLARRAAARPAV
jgi:hypothetical protein